MLYRIPTVRLDMRADEEQVRNQMAVGRMTAETLMDEMAKVYPED